MKDEGKMEKLEKKMRERGELSYLSGARLIVYGRERYYGVFSGVEYANLVANILPKIGPHWSDTNYPKLSYS